MKNYFISLCMIILLIIIDFLFTFFHFEQNKKLFSNISFHHIKIDYKVFKEGNEEGKFWYVWKIFGLKK